MRVTRKAFIEGSSASLLACSLLGAAEAPLPNRHTVANNELFLDAAWQLRSSAADAASDWYPARVPSTVFASLVRNRVYGDPDELFVGENLRKVPGVDYPIGGMYANLPMPASSPFYPSWRYRTTFELPAAFRGKYLTLHVDGINYRANAWLNGTGIATAGELAGMRRTFEFDVTRAARSGSNELEFEVFAPTPGDLALTFVDWNPMPPDKDMGIFRQVRLSASGPVAIRHPQVVTRVDLPSQSRARLSVHATLRNASDRAVRGVLRTRTGDRAVSQSVSVPARRERSVTFSPDAFPALVFERPELWWPANLGPQPLHDLVLEYEIDGEPSDRAQVRFGMREVSGEIDARGQRLFRVNGERMLVLGAGWTPDMMLRDTPKSLEDQIRYVRDMHLNTVRLEGKLADDAFFDLCDRYGIMVFAGWCCCDRWERWKDWTPENYVVARESLRSQLRRLRNHPSMLTWAYGSDNAPPPDVERMYLRVLHEERWPNPYQAAASARTTLVGSTGVKMTGPYDYVAPSYWLDSRAPGGADGFNSETSPGPAVPPLESLRRFIPPDHRWPIDAVWNYHAGSGHFRNIETFTKALEARYGTADSVEDYAFKAQLMTYEGERAMFEAFRRNKYRSTGVVQWMLNNAWPGLIWHLFDYYLRPGGGYFGTKKACEPLHVQYSYDDRSVVVTSELRRAFPGCRVTAETFDLSARRLFARNAALRVPPDSSTRVFAVPKPAGIPVYLLRLALRDSGGRIVSTNTYWLPEKEDAFDWDKSTWFYTPATAYADYTALHSLPQANVQVRSQSRHDGEFVRTTVHLSNPSSTIAFFMRLSVRKGSGGEEMLPVLWSENYVTLFPGERRVLHASYRAAALGTAAPSVDVHGWNVMRSPIG